MLLNPQYIPKRKNSRFKAAVLYCSPRSDSRAAFAERNAEKKMCVVTIDTPQSL